jgi:hypothetical protein
LSSVATSGSARSRGFTSDPSLTCPALGRAGLLALASYMATTSPCPARPPGEPHRSRPASRG